VRINTSTPMTLGFKFQLLPRMKDFKLTGTLNLFMSIECTEVIIEGLINTTRLTEYLQNFLAEINFVLEQHKNPGCSFTCYAYLSYKIRRYKCRKISV
jgi:hypothetical protein